MNYWAFKQGVQFSIDADFHPLVEKLESMEAAILLNNDDVCGAAKA